MQSEPAAHFGYSIASLPIHDPSRGHPGSFTNGPSGAESRVIQRYPYINSADEYKDAQIYGIYENSDGDGDVDDDDIKYVGQTTDERVGARFVEHASNDSWAPWHKDKCGGYGDDDTQWLYVPREIEAIENVSKFETTVDEQYWYEQKGGRDLLNKNQPLKNATFHTYKDEMGNYDAGKIGLAATWEPTDN